MLPTLSKLSLGRGIPIRALHGTAPHFLQYATTYPDAAIQYRPSAMRLVIWSDTSYLSESAGGLHYLTGHSDPLNIPVNGATDIASTIIPTIVSSAAEAELAGLFLNGQLGIASRTTLSHLGYPKLPPRSSPITLLHKAVPINLCGLNAVKPSICVISGFVISSSNNTSPLIGPRSRKSCLLLHQDSSYQDLLAQTL